MILIKKAFFNNKNQKNIALFIDHIIIKQFTLKMTNPFEAFNISDDEE